MRAVIVGGSRGIGRACIDRLQADGWDTIDLSRTSGCDVTKPRQFEDQLATLRVDAAVYSAGHVTPADLTDLDDDEWHETLAVNLLGAVRLLRWAAAGGSPVVVLIASTAGTRPSPRWAAYAASKAALINLGVTAAAELAGRVRVYTLTPGRCATDLRRRLAPDEDPATIMQPAEVADVVASCIADHTGVLAGAPIEVKRR